MERPIEALSGLLFLDRDCCFVTTECRVDVNTRKGAIAPEDGLSSKIFCYHLCISARVPVPYSGI